MKCYVFLETKGKQGHSSISTNINILSNNLVAGGDNISEPEIIKTKSNIGEWDKRIYRNAGVNVKKSLLLIHIDF